MPPTPQSPEADAVAAPHERAPPGALRCQKDSMLRSLATRVLACHEVIVPATKKTPAERFFEVELYDTVLFPEGGGQPWDTGRIGAAVVDKVYVRDGRCLHRVPSSPSSPALPPFEPEQDVVVTLDWERRFDHMQQHSAQHLLSAIAEKHGYDTTTWSMGEERNKVELVPFPDSAAAAAHRAHKLKVMPSEVLLQIEAEVNAAIVAGLTMTPTFATPGTAEWAAIAAKFSADAAPAAMRVVCIDGLDANPCCGTHVPTLSLLRSLRVLTVEAARGATRVWFVAGERVNREFARMFQREQALVKLLSCGPDEHAARTEKLLQAHKASLKEIKDLQQELTASIAAQLVAQSEGASAGVSAEVSTDTSVSTTTSAIPPSSSIAPPPVVHYYRADGDLPFLQAVVAHLGDAMQRTLFVLAAGDARGPGSGSSSSSGEGTFILAGPAPFILQHGRDVVQLVDGKGGGGKNGVFQGKAKALNQLDALVARLTELRLAEA